MQEIIFIEHVSPEYKEVWTQLVTHCAGNGFLESGLLNRAAIPLTYRVFALLIKNYEVSFDNTITQSFTVNLEGYPDDSYRPDRLLEEANFLKQAAEKCVAIVKEHISHQRIKLRGINLTPDCCTIIVEENYTREG